MASPRKAPLVMSPHRITNPNRHLKTMTIGRGSHPYGEANDTSRAGPALHFFIDYRHMENEAQSLCHFNESSNASIFAMIGLSYVAQCLDNPKKQQRQGGGEGHTGASGPHSGYYMSSVDETDGSQVILPRFEVFYTVVPKKLFGVDLGPVNTDEELLTETSLLPDELLYSHQNIAGVLYSVFVNDEALKIDERIEDLLKVCRWLNNSQERKRRRPGGQAPARGGGRRGNRRDGDAEAGDGAGGDRYRTDSLFQDEAQEGDGDASSDGSGAAWDEKDSEDRAIESRVMEIYAKIQKAEVASEDPAASKRKYAQYTYSDFIGQANRSRSVPLECFFRWVDSHQAWAQVVVAPYMGDKSYLDDASYKAHGFSLTSAESRLHYSNVFTIENAIRKMREAGGDPRVCDSERVRAAALRRSEYGRATLGLSADAEEEFYASHGPALDRASWTCNAGRGWCAPHAKLCFRLDPEQFSWQYMCSVKFPHVGLYYRNKLEVLGLARPKRKPEVTREGEDGIDLSALAEAVGIATISQMQEADTVARGPELDDTDRVHEEQSYALDQLSSRYKASCPLDRLLDPYPGEYARMLAIIRAEGQRKYASLRSPHALVPESYAQLVRFLREEGVAYHEQPIPTSNLSVFGAMKVYDAFKYEFTVCGPPGAHPSMVYMMRAVATPLLPYGLGNKETLLVAGPPGAGKSHVQREVMKCMVPGTFTTVGGGSNLAMGLPGKKATRLVEFHDEAVRMMTLPLAQLSGGEDKARRLFQQKMSETEVTYVWTHNDPDTGEKSILCDRMRSTNASILNTNTNGINVGSEENPLASRTTQLTLTKAHGLDRELVHAINARGTSEDLASIETYRLHMRHFHVARMDYWGLVNACAVPPPNIELFKLMLTLSVDFLAACHKGIMDSSRLMTKMHTAALVETADYALRTGLYSPIAHTMTGGKSPGTVFFHPYSLDHIVRAAPYACCTEDIALYLITQFALELLDITRYKFLLCLFEKQARYDPISATERERQDEEREAMSEEQRAAHDRARRVVRARFEDLLVQRIEGTEMQAPYALTYYIPMDGGDRKRAKKSGGHSSSSSSSSSGRKEGPVYGSYKLNMSPPEGLPPGSSSKAYLVTEAYSKSRPKFKLEAIGSAEYINPNYVRVPGTLDNAIEKVVEQSRDNCNFSVVKNKLSPLYKETMRVPYFPLIPTDSAWWKANEGEIVNMRHDPEFVSQVPRAEVKCIVQGVDCFYVLASLADDDPHRIIHALLDSLCYAKTRERTVVLGIPSPKTNYLPDTHYMRPNPERTCLRALNQRHVTPSAAAVLDSCVNKEDGGVSDHRMDVFEEVSVDAEETCSRNYIIQNFPGLADNAKYTADAVDKRVHRMLACEPFSRVKRIVFPDDPERDARAKEDTIRKKRGYVPLGAHHDSGGMAEYFESLHSSSRGARPPSVASACPQSRSAGGATPSTPFLADRGGRAYAEGNSRRSSVQSISDDSTDAPMLSGRGSRGGTVQGPPSPGTGGTPQRRTGLQVRPSPPSGPRAAPSYIQDDTDWSAPDDSHLAQMSL